MWFSTLLVRSYGNTTLLTACKKMMLTFATVIHPILQSIMNKIQNMSKIVCIHAL